MPQDFSTYDSYLDEIGLIYAPEAQQVTASVAPAVQQRQDDGQNPNEMRPEAGFHFSQADWAEGEGQEKFHAPNRNPSKYFYSEGFDISKRDILSSLHATDDTLTFTGSPGTIRASLEQVGDQLFAAWGGNASNPNVVHKHDGDWPGTWSTEDADDGETSAVVPGPTRWYIQNAAAPASPTFSAGWNVTAAADRATMAKTKSGAVVGNIVDTQGATDPQSVLGVQGVTSALETGTEFATTDTLTAVFEWGRTDAEDFADLKMAIIVKVMASDNTTTRATLYDNEATGGADTDFAATPATTRIRTSVNLANAYTTVANDYLVVEVGFVASGYDGSGSDSAVVGYGGTDADFPLSSGVTDAGHNWVEFSNGIALSGAGGAVPIYDLAAKGDVLYAAMGANGIHDRDAAGTWNHYSDATATIVAWVKDRLMAADANEIWEITASGAAPSAKETLADGWEFTSIFENGEYIYATAINEEINQSRVHHYGLVSGTLTKVGSTPLPRGEFAYCGKGYLDVVYLGCGKRTTGGDIDSGARDPILYQAFPDDNGFLRLLKVAEEDRQNSTAREIRAIEPVTDGVYAGWHLSDFQGISKHNIARDAFSTNLQYPITPGQGRVTDIIVHKGRVIAAIPGLGVFYEDVDNFEATATMITSMADFNTAGLKTWRTFEIEHPPLPSGTSVAMSYSLEHPDEDNWTLIGTNSTADSLGTSFVLDDVSSRRLALKIVSSAHADQSVAPRISSFTVRSDPKVEITKAEWRMFRTWRAFPRDRKTRRGQVVNQNPRNLAESLRNLLYTWVTLYEPGVTYSARVEAVQVTRLPTSDVPSTAGNNDREGYLIEMALSGTEQ